MAPAVRVSFAAKARPGYSGSSRPARAIPGGSCVAWIWGTRTKARDPV
jgi:hypothetical protein